MSPSDLPVAEVLDRIAGPRCPCLPAGIDAVTDRVAASDLQGVVTGTVPGVG
jgi:hypothetical protein